jgi:hypothetical protein
MLYSKFVLLPSDADASPRLLVESIVRNRPLVVNLSIYGGWKYINDKTGVFFEAPSIKECYKEKYIKDYEYYRSNLILSVKKVLDMKNFGDISKNFYEQYGFKKSSKRLAVIMNELCDINYEYICYKEWEKALKRII